MSSQTKPSPASYEAEHSLEPNASPPGYQAPSAPISHTASMDPTHDPVIGKQLANLRVVDKLGQGGFGTVYKAKHIFVGKPFAVKLLKLSQQSNPEIVARFQREARALSLLDHENIVYFQDFGELPGYGFYMAMEHLAGVSLHERVRGLAKARQLVPLIEIKKLMVQMCDVLQYIHRKNIVHRDLKPSNIFLKQLESGEEKVKLLDFGIVALTAEDSDLTNTGVSLGTANYISPEQARGSKSLDGRSDLYSLGVMLYRLLTHKLPFKGESPVDTIIMHIQDQPPTLAKNAPYRQWAPRLETFIQIALSKDKNRRPPDAETFGKWCVEALEEQMQMEGAGHSQAQNDIKKTSKLDQERFMEFVAAAREQEKLSDQDSSASLSSNKEALSELPTGEKTGEDDQLKRLSSPEGLPVGRLFAGTTPESSPYPMAPVGVPSSSKPMSKALIGVIAFVGFFGALGLGWFLKPNGTTPASKQPALRIQPAKQAEAKPRKMAPTKRVVTKKTPKPQQNSGFVDPTIEQRNKANKALKATRKKLRAAKARYRLSHKGRYYGLFNKAKRQIRDGQYKKGMQSLYSLNKKLHSLSTPKRFSRRNIKRRLVPRKPPIIRLRRAPKKVRKPIKKRPIAPRPVLSID